jgi:hypothetical protein
MYIYVDWNKYYVTVNKIISKLSLGSPSTDSFVIVTGAAYELNVKEGIEEMTLEVLLRISSLSLFQQLQIEISDIIVKPLIRP